MLYKINLFYNNNSFDLFFECPEWKKYIKLVVFNKKFLKFFAKLPRPKYIPCVDTRYQIPAGKINNNNNKYNNRARR